MELKCIGGECDGKLWQVANYHRVGDLVRVAGKKPEFKVRDFALDVDDFRNGRVPKDMVQVYCTYRIAIFNFNKEDTYKFLVPDGWTDKQAILFQFGK